MTEKEKKKMKIIELMGVALRYSHFQFFDLESDEMLDEKIEVLEALRDGKTIAEIPNYYKILELYPDDNVLWD